MNDYPGGWFGENWRAPVLQEGRHLPTPVGVRCTECAQKITEGDQGMLIPVASMTPPVLSAYHLTCFLRSIRAETRVPALRCCKTQHLPTKGREMNDWSYPPLPRPATDDALDAWMDVIRMQVLVDAIIASAPWPALTSAMIGWADEMAREADAKISTLLADWPTPPPREKEIWK